MSRARRKKILFVFGTRPEAIKLAPVIAALRRRKSRLIGRVAVTAQHRELLDGVLAYFRVKVDHDLDIMRHGQSLTDISVRVLSRLNAVMTKEKPDIVVVQGDTTSTLMAALSATHHRVPVAHVEAGLRSGNADDPFPEEINRIMTDRLSVLHFAPTPAARSNLLAEGISAKEITVTGNTGIDALQFALRRGGRRPPKFARAVRAAVDKGCAVLTLHRRENRGRALDQILLGARDFARANRERAVVCPMHPRPALRKRIEEVIGREENVVLIEPLPYSAMIQLLARCRYIVTDSGGLQEEAPALGKPLLIARRTTERPEGVLAGTAKIIGCDRRRVARWMGVLARPGAAFDRMSRVAHPYGRGTAADKIVAGLRSYFRRRPVALFENTL